MLIGFPLFCCFPACYTVLCYIVHVTLYSIIARAPHAGSVGGLNDGAGQALDWKLEGAVGAFTLAASFCWRLWAILLTL